MPLHAGCQDYAQMTSEDPQGRRIHHLDHSHSKKVLPDVQRKIQAFGFVLLVCHWASPKRVWVLLLFALLSDFEAH